MCITKKVRVSPSAPGLVNPVQGDLGLNQARLYNACGEQATATFETILRSGDTQTQHSSVHLVRLDAGGGNVHRERLAAILYRSICF
jgi:hypothetical protein